MTAVRRAKVWLGFVGALAVARAVDVALIGTGVAVAAGSVVFAGAMLMQGDHPPVVNGLEYLAIFAKPHGAGKAGPTGDPPRAASAPLDMSPVGAITPNALGNEDEIAIVSAQADFAWVHEGSRIVAVRPGDALPRLGQVNAIRWRQGRWVILGPSGETLLASGGPDAHGVPATQAPFGRQMIFGGGD